MPKATARIRATDVIGANLVDDDGQFEIPIDTIALAKKMGIDVQFSSELGEGVSGVIVKTPEETSAHIYLNAGDAAVRQRFTCAHEIGHYIRNKDNGKEKFGYVDERADLAATGDDLEERWSNAFAAELLMPAFAVRQLFENESDTAKLAREFGVSSAAMGFRLRNLYLA